MKFQFTYCTIMKKWKTCIFFDKKNYSIALQFPQFIALTPPNSLTIQGRSVDAGLTVYENKGFESLVVSEDLSK